MSEQSENKVQLAVIENALAALAKTLLRSLQDKASFCEQINALTDAIESSPEGQHSEYSSDERLEISARLSDFTLLIR